MMKILEDVLEKVKPNKKKRERLKELSERLIEKAKEESKKLEISVKPELVGSAARGTWLSDEQDIDLFLLFPEDVSREKLEEKGLEIGKKITKNRGSEQYAEHPYINAKIDGFDVDVVPCYDIDNPIDLRSAVDRSPHHQEYIKGWLTPDKVDQVLLLKKFLKGIGVYGSELKTHGFSGYLCELLIIQFGSFLELINSAKKWKAKKIIDPENKRDPEELQKMFPDQSLVVIDPVDPSRNVSAAVSKKNYATFVRACRDFAREPKKEFFFPDENPSTKEKLRQLIESRGTKIFMIFLEIPFDLVPDIVYPQLRKTRRSLVKKLEGADFEVIRSGVWSKKHKAVLLLELTVSELPSTKKHLGPPIEVDGKSFIQKHLESERKLAGPFIDKDGRLVFELKREETQAKGILREAMNSQEGFGSHIQKTVKSKGYEIFENGEIIEKAEELNAFNFLGDYLTRCLSWYR